MTDDRPLLSIRASGEAAHGGRLPLAELARIAGEFQATVERIALGLQGPSPAVGRRPQSVHDAVGMDVRAFTSVPAVLTVGRLSEPVPDDDILVDSLEILEAGIATIARYQQAPDVFTAPVLDGLLRLSSGIADRTMSAVEIQRGGRTTISFNRRLYAQLHAIRRSVNVEERVISGRLQTGGFAPGDHRCQIDTLSGNISCTFGDDLTATVLAATGSLVRASGYAEVHVHGRRINPHLRDPDSRNAPRIPPTGHSTNSRPNRV